IRVIHHHRRVVDAVDGDGHVRRHFVPIAVRHGVRDADGGRIVNAKSVESGSRRDDKPGAGIVEFYLEPGKIFIMRALYLWFTDLDARRAFAVSSEADT